MVAASSSLRDISIPERLTQMGSPKGAEKLNRIGVPGKNPISSNLIDNCSSVKPEITADSPAFIMATVLGVVSNLI